VMQALSPGAGPSQGLRHADSEPVQLEGANTGSLAASSHTQAAIQSVPGGLATPTGGEDPFAQAAATAAAAAASAGAALSAERAAREVAEGKLKEARLALERKTAHAK
jgi:hypothetical protein